MERIWLKFYDGWVQADISIPPVTYLEVLEKTFAEFREKPALEFLGASLSFNDLNRHSLCFADFLAKNGCDPGDIVAINLPNIPQFLIAHTGALRAGCLPTGLSPLLGPKEMAYQLSDCQAKVLVTLNTILEEKFSRIMDEVPYLRHVVVCDMEDFLKGGETKLPTGGIPLEKRLFRFMDLLDEHRPMGVSMRFGPQDACLLQYTGGTTGVPKGALLTNYNLIAHMMQFNQWLEMGRGSEIYLSAFPFTHLAGLTNGMAALCGGNTQIIIPNPRDTQHVCKEIEDRHPTVLAFVPSLYQMLMREPQFRSLDFSRCRLFLSGAAPFDLESMTALENLVGTGKIVEVYGMTETFILTMNPYQGMKKTGSVGIPLQSTWVKIVDLDGGDREMPLGKEGELIARGPQVMKGYLKNPQETERTFRKFKGETWICTGDVARMDEDGYLTIVDRAKDMIIVGGYKVFSREVEEVLYEHPDVAYCAVVGRPNPERPGSELVTAIVQPTREFYKVSQDTLKSELSAHCRETLAPYKVPKLMELVDDLPLTPVGKVDKKRLKS